MLADVFAGFNTAEIVLTILAAVALAIFIVKSVR